MVFSPGRLQDTKDGQNHHRCPTQSVSVIHNSDSTSQHLQLDWQQTGLASRDFQMSLCIHTERGV